jgi:hypothetical protein
VVADIAPRHFRCLPSGRGIVAMINERGVDNLWELPVDGSKRRQLTTFEDDAIFRFDISHEARYAIARGRAVREVVLINLR